MKVYAVHYAFRACQVIDVNEHSKIFAEISINVISLSWILSRKVMSLVQKNVDKGPLFPSANYNHMATKGDFLLK